MNETIEISVEEYNELKRANLFLECLKGAGVDNWDGYDFACEEFETLNAPTTSV